MLVCPNKNDRVYKLLEKHIPELEIYQLFINNGYELPSIGDAYIIIENNKLKSKETKPLVSENKVKFISKSTMLFDNNVSDLQQIIPNFNENVKEEYNKFINTLPFDILSDDLKNNPEEMVNEENQPCAEKGLKTEKFTPGSKWTIIQDLKGMPSHKQGGVDLKFGKDGISFSKNNVDIKAKYGLVFNVSKVKAEKGMVMPSDPPTENSFNKFVNKAKTALNPYNWGVTDYTEQYSDKNKAFAAARKAGEKEYLYKGVRYNTRKDTDDINITMPDKNINRNWTPESYNEHLKQNYPEFFKLINRGKGVNEITFTHDNFSENEPKRGSYSIINNKIYLGKNEIDDENGYFGQNNVLGTIIAEMAHAKDDKLTDFTYKTKTGFERIIRGENTYNKEGNVEYNTHRLYEPGLAMIAYGDLSPSDIKRIQRHLGVKEDGYFGENTYKALQKKYENSDYVRTNLNYHREVTSDDDKYPMRLGTYPSVAKAYLHQLNQDVPLRNSKRFYDSLAPISNYTDNALLNIIPGSGDYDVSLLQEGLRNRGYKLPKSTKKDGSFDGVWGKETEQALLDYQSKFKK